jgi:hypothetical protein
MTENTNQVKHPAEPARGDRLRACLIEMLAFGLGALAVFQYKPEGILAEFIVFIGAYTIASSLLHVLFLAALGQLLLTVLTPAIHLYTLAIVPVGTSGTGLAFTFLLPGIAQAYLALGVVAGDGCPVSPADRDVHGVAGGARDLDFGLACAAFAEAPPRSNETTPRNQKRALIHSVGRKGTSSEKGRQPRRPPS